MDLVTPDIGLLFWMTISFLIVLLLLRKFAWKPILSSLKEREETISNALDEAKKARKEMANQQAGNEALLAEARAERDVILREATETKVAIVAEAREKAKAEGEKAIKIARETIHNEKMAAITELKNQVATLSIEIAEKILKEELSSEEKQKSLISNLLDDVSLN
jgi:F-type H+-transporting ATPase subunit b